MIFPLLICGCMNMDDATLFKKLEKEIDFIVVESGYGNFNIVSLESIEKITNWILSSKEFKPEYASYPFPQVKLIIKFHDGEEIIVYTTYPADSLQPAIIKYKSNYYIASNYPEIPEYKNFSFSK